MSVHPKYVYQSEQWKQKLCVFAAKSDYFFCIDIAAIISKKKIKFFLTKSMYIVVKCARLQLEKQQ